MADNPETQSLWKIMAEYRAKLEARKTHLMAEVERNLQTVALIQGTLEALDMTRQRVEIDA